MIKTLCYISICTLLFIACNKEKENIAEDISNAEKNKTTKDTLIDYYRQIILDYYIDKDTNDYKIELNVKGRREYEDDSILILTFDEILKFGSWHYTESSLLFFKSESALIPIPTASTNRILNDDFYERDIQYPNRIQGIFKQKIDLTGDGKPEYIFHSSGMIRTSLEEKYNIYQFNTDTKTLEITNLSIPSNGFQGECDTTYGKLREFKIIEVDSLNPIIEIKEIISTCDGMKVKIEEVNYSHYGWMEKRAKFEELMFTKNKRYSN